MSGKRRLVILMLAVGQGLLIVMASAWHYALRVNDGILWACVDCLSEGFIEMLVFAALIMLGSAAISLEVTKED